MPFYGWSTTSATNATADASINWAEGQAPSSVNDSARAMMAALAKYRDDITGSNGTGGTSSAYTLTSNQVFTSRALASAQVVAFTPHVTNAASATLNVDSLGAAPIIAGGAVIPAGVLIAHTPYLAFYDNGDNFWVLHNFHGNPYNIPLGGSLDYWGATAPNSSFIFPSGQAISRSTYSDLFSLFSTSYGVGDGSTTFNVPDLRGRVTAGKDDMGGSAASRLTSTYFGTSAAALGAVGGQQAQGLGTANMAPYTPTGTIGSISVTSALSYFQTNIGPTLITDGSGGSNHYAPAAGSTVAASQVSSTGSAPSFTGAPQGGTSAQFTITQPSIICNKILRVI